MADETALLPLGFAAIAEAAVDFPCGFIVAEEANVFSLVFWSLETEELPLEIVIWENLMDFNGNINYEKRFINIETKKKVKGIHWLKFNKKDWLDQVVVKRIWKRVMKEVKGERQENKKLRQSVERKKW